MHHENTVSEMHATPDKQLKTASLQLAQGTSVLIQALNP